jgi:hypothetical protein
MAWLAWLMLAVAPAYGMPSGMMDGARYATPLSHMVDHIRHVMPMMVSDCCADQVHADHGAMTVCHCAVTCASVLPALAIAEFAPVALDAMHVPRHGAVAPGIIPSPPLRPPLIQTSSLT